MEQLGRGYGSQLALYCVRVFMFEIFIFLLVAGDPDPQIMHRTEPQFATQKECDAALPAEDARLEERLKTLGKERKTDYDFQLKCRPSGDPA